MAEWAQAIAGLFTFLAAVWAVRAAYRAPKEAAKLAEQLRRQNSHADERDQTRRAILATLLQHRATVAYPMSVNALNMIDIAFSDQPEVRAAFRHFLEATRAKPYSSDRITERYLSIIEKMARAMGLSDTISIQDINNAYFPEFLGMQHELTVKEVNDRWQEAFGKTAEPLANNAPSVIQNAFINKPV